VPAGSSPAFAWLFLHSEDGEIAQIRLARIVPSAVLLRNATSSLFHQRHIGRVLVGGVKLPRALAELGLIDEYEFVVQPRLVGHGPPLFAGLSKHVDLRLVSRLEFGSGAVAMRYEPGR
jgi:dihydrofolate reductase